jgi:hypothetical protein
MILGGIFNQTNSISLFTDLSFVDYKGLVIFYCGIGTERFVAVQSMSKFDCSFNATSISNKDELYVQLYAKHSISQEELLISSNNATYKIYSNSRIC